MDSIVRAALTYWFLYFILRILGRRAYQQTTGFELILIFLFGGMTIQAVVTDDRSLTNAWLSVMTIAMMHIIVTIAEGRVDSIGSRLEGTPIPIAERGVWFKDRLRAMRILEQDVMASARLKGIERFDQIDSAVVERNGSIAVFAKKE